MIEQLNTAWHTLCLSVGVGGESAFDRCLHTPPQLLASEIKQTFLSTNLACSLAFKQQAAGPYLSVILQQPWKTEAAKLENDKYSCRESIIWKALP